LGFLGNKKSSRREYENVIDAIAEEKRIKKWRRAWKIQLIEEMNSDWRDLYPDLA